jgi:Cytochrome c7 and related cytochrome c/Class III cytochrome C family
MRRALSFIGFTLAVAVAWIWALPAIPAAQPIAFNHARHQALACAVCHQGVETAAHAGLPDGALCAKCHATAPGRVTTDKQWTAIARGQPIEWVRVTHVPDHVRFSHQRHTTLAGLSCSSCHGDIGQRIAPPGVAPVRLTMNTCLDCHKREGASADCAGCHR